MNGLPPSSLPELAELPQRPVEVYRSHWRPASEERAFVLHAVGIESHVLRNGPDWSLYVMPGAAAAAASQLRTYERENPPRRRVLKPEGTHPHAWLGALGYTVVILVVAWFAGQKAWATDWLDAGALVTTSVRHGEAWRAITALTLHLDVGHLLGNLGFGAFFGWLAAQLLGPGVALGAGAAAAAGANLLNASIQPASHVSAGASTLVFALLGLLAAYAWRRRAGQGDRWAYRWAPLVAGLFLLGFTGAGGERTDVLAHLTGFFVGGVAGLLLALRSGIPGCAAQWASGGATLLAVGLAWLAALSANP